VLLLTRLGALIGQGNLPRVTLPSRACKSFRYIYTVLGLLCYQPESSLCACRSGSWAGPIPAACQSGGWAVARFWRRSTVLPGDAFRRCVSSWGPWLYGPISFSVLLPNNPTCSLDPAFNRWRVITLRF
jgi:hypothetical protein